MKQLRALHVSTNPEMGGGERQLLALIEGSRRRDVAAHLIARRDSPCLAAALRAGLPATPLTLHLRFDPAAIARLARLLKSESFDVIHLHDGGAATIGVAAARFAKVPAIVHRRIASPLRRGILSRWKHDPERVARFIAVSRAVAEVLRAAGIPQEKISVVPSGVDVARLDALERSAASGTRLATVGKLAPKKGVDVVLRAFARILEARPDARLLVVGDGPEREALERIAGPRVEFAGSVPDGAARLAGSDLLLFASELEGSPAAVREAMALRIPVVAADAPGTAEVLADTGVLVPRGDAEAMAQAALALLSDAARRAALVAAARARVVAAFSMDSMTESTLAVAREVLAAR